MSDGENSEHLGDYNVDEEAFDGVYLEEAGPTVDEIENQSITQYSLLQLSEDGGSEFSATESAPLGYLQPPNAFVPSNKSLVPDYPIDSEENITSQQKDLEGFRSNNKLQDKSLEDARLTPLPGQTQDPDEVTNQTTLEKSLTFNPIAPAKRLGEYISSRISIIGAGNMDNRIPNKPLKTNNISPTYSMVSFYPFFGKRPEIFPFKYIPSLMGESGPSNTSKTPAAMKPIATPGASLRNTSVLQAHECTGHQTQKLTPKRSTIPNLVQGNKYPFAEKPEPVIQPSLLDIHQFSSQTSIDDEYSSLQIQRESEEETKNFLTSQVMSTPKYSASDEVSVATSREPKPGNNLKDVLTLSKVNSVQIEMHRSDVSSRGAALHESENIAPEFISILDKLKTNYSNVNLNDIRDEVFASKAPVISSNGISGVKTLVDSRSKVEIYGESQLEFIDYFAQKDGYVYIGILETSFVNYYEKTQVLIRSKESRNPGSRDRAEVARNRISQIYKIIQVNEEKELQDFDFPAALERDSKVFEIDYMPKIVLIGKLHNYGVHMILYYIKLLLLDTYIAPVSVHTFATELLADIVTLCYGIFTKISDFLTQLITEPSEEQLRTFTLDTMIQSFRHLVDSICDEIGAIGQSCSQILIRIKNLEEKEILPTLTSIYKQVNYANISISRAMEALAPAIHFYYVKYFL